MEKTSKKKQISKEWLDVIIGTTDLSRDIVIKEAEIIVEKENEKRYLNKPLTVEESIIFNSQY